MSEKGTGRKKISKLSLQNDFYSDLSYVNMLYAVIIRSPTDKGIITSISHTDLPDGYYIFTARDVPGKNIIDTPLGKVPIFSEGNISYLGEPLGILCGPDEKKLQELLNEIEIVFDSTPIESYLQIENETQEVKKNGRKKSSGSENLQIEDFFSVKLSSRKVEYGPCFKKNMEGNIPGINSVFDQCTTVVQGSWVYNISYPDYREPNGALCSFSGDTLTVYTPTQWLANLRFTLSDALNIKSDNILVKKTKSFSSSTNSIWYNSIIASQVAVAAIKTGKTVKLVFSRSEQSSFMETLQPVTITHKTGIDENGKLKAMQVDIDVDAGAYNPFSQEIIDRLIIASCGCYTSENISINATAYRTSKAPSSIDHDLIDSAAFFAIENQMNELSRKTNFSPVEIRTINMMGNTKGVTKPFNLKKKKFIDSTLAIAKISDFNRRWSSYNMDMKQREAKFETTESTDFYISPLRGIGLACAFEGNGYYGSEIYNNEQYIETILSEDGNVTIHCAPVSHSIQEIWTKTAASILEQSQSTIKINTNFEADEEPPLPETVYSNVGVMTDLLIKCCNALKKRPSSVQYPYVIRRKISPVTKKEWNKEAFTGTPFHSNSFAVTTVELELNPFTYREQIKSIYVVVNCGKVLYAQAAESSIRLGIQKILQNLVEDDQVDCENIHISFMQSEESPGQLGELVYQTIPAAYTQALTQALCCTINTLPLRTDTIYYRLEEQKKIEDARRIAEETRKKQEEEKAKEEAEKAKTEQSEEKSDKEKTDKEKSEKIDKSEKSDKENTKAGKINEDTINS